MSTILPGMPAPKKKSSMPAEPSNLLTLLQQRFAAHPERHPELSWEEVEKKLKQKPEKLNIIAQMEATGGEPDVVTLDAKSKEIIFCDCSRETPAGRRSLCYDEAARLSRKQHPPEGSALGMARSMGIELLNEEQYYQLQQLGEFDLKTSSWLLTPPEVRNLGGALFGDRRYGRVFTYHNGADSYYGVRGFRGWVKI